MASLFDAFPQLKIEILSGTAVVDLLRREADLALRFVRPTHAELLCRKVSRIVMRVFCVRELADRDSSNLRTGTAEYHQVGVVPTEYSGSDV